MRLLRIVDDVRTFFKITKVMYILLTYPRRITSQLLYLHPKRILTMRINLINTSIMEEQTSNPTVPPTEAPINKPIKKSRKSLWLTCIIVIVVLLVIVVGYKIVKRPNTQQISYSTTNQQVPSPTTPATQSVSNNTQNSGQSVNKTNTSNSQLDQDLKTVQGNLNQLSSDQSNANQAIQNQSSDNQQ
jgi:uncharacterized protein HemX